MLKTNLESVYTEKEQWLSSLWERWYLFALQRQQSDVCRREHYVIC